MRQRFKTLKTLRVTLAADEEAVKGNFAFVSSEDGLCYADPSGHVDLIPVGRFIEAFTGDGSRTTAIDLLKEIIVHGWNNDSAPNHVQAADLFGEVYARNGTTVSTSDSGGTRPRAGLAILIEEGSVYVLAPFAAL